MSQLQLPVELPRTKPTMALESCADFFDRDYDTLLADIENRIVRFAWNIAAGPLILPTDQTAPNKAIRIYAESAWAFCYGRPMPGISEDDVYRLIIPNRNIRSTELKRILACSSDHVHNLKVNFVTVREPLQEDGPNSFTVFSRDSIVKFLKARRIS